MKKDVEKYVCPKCGGAIRFWNEFFFYKKQSINPYTGEYGRIVSTEPQEHNCGDMHGFECVNCNWSANVISQKYPDYLNDLLDD